MDLQKIISEALEALTNNEELRSSFDIDPVKALEKILRLTCPTIRSTPSSKPSRPS